jgi:PDZ domain-containing protein
MDLLEVESTSDYPVFEPNGELRILTVNSWGGPAGPLVVGDALRSIWDRAITIEPVEFLYPEPVDSETEKEEGEFQFSSSGNTAIAVALTYLGIPLESHLKIFNLNADGPAAGLLAPGDILRKLDDSEILTFDDLTAFMEKQKPNNTIDVTVERNNQLKTYEIKTFADEEGKARIGIYLFTEYIGPMDITVHLENVGGPSAGLAFTLAIYDKLTAGNLLQGRNIAVTGTIEFDSSVGAIGGMYQKMAAAKRAGASLMLIPAANCVDTTKGLPDGLQIVPVSSFAEAVAVLEGSIKPLPACTVSNS